MTDSCEINIDKLIVEIKKRPAIYNCNLPEYKDRGLKNYLWSQVCEIVVPNWSELGSRDKFTRGREVQREWKTLLTSFQRELYRHARDKLVHGKKTSNRKYLFLNKMKFLLSTGTIESLEKFMGEPFLKKSLSREIQSQLCLKCSKRKSSCLERRICLDEIDDDKAFLLSLLPSLKELTPNQKFAVRISIMNTIVQIQDVPMKAKLAESNESFIKNKSPDNISIYSLSQSNEIFKQKESLDQGDFKPLN